MIDRSQLGPPIDVRGLFPMERSALLALLGGLAAGDWDRATVCPSWTVKDVTAHLLHDDLRRLVSMRDGHQGPRPVAGETVAAFLDRVNQEWVTATRCLSSRQLVELLTLTGEQIAVLWRAQDPDADGAAVSWRGWRWPRSDWTRPGSSASTGPTSSRCGRPPGGPGSPTAPGWPRCWTRSCWRCPTPCATPAPTPARRSR